MKISIQQLRYFLSIAEIGSLAESARRLGVSKGTLSAAVAAIEKAVGFAVFTSGHAGMQLTEGGKELVEYAQRVAREMNALETHFGIAAATAKDGLIGAPAPARLSVEITPLGFAVEALTNVAAQHQNDGSVFSVGISHVSQIAHDVHAGEVDMGIMHISSKNGTAMLRLIEDEDLEFHKLFAAAYYAYVGRNHPLAGHTSVSYTELGLYPTFGLEQYLYLGLNQPSKILVTGTPGEREDLYRRIFTPVGDILSNFVTVNGCLIYCNLLSNNPAFQNAPVSIPIETDERMHMGYVVRKGHALTTLEREYVNSLKKLAPR